VLVLATLGAPPPPRRRRRRARPVEADAPPEALSLTRATLIGASETFDTPEEAGRWLEDASADEGAVERHLAEGIEALNRALHAHAVASGEPNPQALAAQRAVAMRLGYGNGEEVARSEFTAAREIDARAGASRRQRRDEELRPQERVAAVLGGRERLDACETLLLRARADLDANRTREAALQLRVGLEALLVELPDALDDPDHAADMQAIESRRDEALKLATSALQGDLDSDESTRLADLLSLCERVLRRRRVLRG
jgi:hypothetical protein